MSLLSPRHLIRTLRRPLQSAATSALPPVRHSKSGKIIVEAPETKITTLDSGLRVATENSRMSTATVGVWIDGGSRYETEQSNGVAHFLEHMNFKGTRNRTQMDLELEVENMGAHLNAYTSREQTVYYARCFSQDLERGGVYGTREIENERAVITREMQEVEQNMQEVVFDHLHAGAYYGCSLSRTILGPLKNIRSLTRADMLEYIRTFYKGQRMVLCGAGGIDHNKLVELGKKYFANIERGSDAVLEYESGVFRNSCQVFKNRNMDMIYGCLAVEGTSWTHPDNTAMQLFNTLVGQYDRIQGAARTGSSLLASSASKLGTQSFMSFTTSYKDTGLAGVYFCVEEDSLAKFTEEITTVWKKMCYFKDEERLKSVKRSLFTNMLLMLDGSSPICEDIGRSMTEYKSANGTSTTKVMERPFFPRKAI
ncbi:insulinase (Peptidase family m16) domain-containing protein [Ditylenchus destructor]|uniref:Insulinase (Peptidase family m16) domain-containing protein n=1 Tax=Ditylenchus destructor TaxID=166010 RepID=A0AAD4RCC1_9BILA|nr:insulinase (Peptidase family m16) domain-containing protein [Ditylenchus destructor]